MKIAIGTTNKAKVESVKISCNKHLSNDFKLEAISVDSAVSNQPFSDEETRLGAINRAKAAREVSDADIGIGLEGGVKWVGKELYLCNWASLVTKEQVYTAAGAQIPLPVEIAKQLMNNKELGPVMDAYVGQDDTRQREGAIGIFTNGIINRSEMFVHIVDLLIGQYLYANSEQ